MLRWPRILIVVLGGLIALTLSGPLLLPVPRIENTVPPEQLAFADSRFVDIDGTTIHYREAGSPDAPITFILLHGFGASTHSWRDQMPALAERGRVIAFDRPAFGLTERPMPGEWDGTNPYSIEANAEQVIGLMDELGVKKAVLVGHSAGGAVAAVTAARHPDRTQGLVLEAPAVYEARSTPAAVSAVMRSPQMRRVGPRLVRRIAGAGSDDFVRSAYFRSDFATPGLLAGYRLPLQAENWDRALWELVAAPRPESPSAALPMITAPTLVVAGRQDTFVSYENSKRAAEAIDGAQLVTFERTGHLPHEEDPEAFANAVYRFVDAFPDVECND